MERVKQYQPRRLETVKKFSGREPRDTAIYNEEWTEYAKRFLKTNPNCYACGLRAEAVDHIRVHKGDIKLFKQIDNHLPLCHRCHNTITALFDRWPIQKFEKKLEWIKNQRDLNKVLVKVRVLPYYGRER